MFLFTIKFLPFKDIPAFSIFSLPSKLPAVQLLLIQLTDPTYYALQGYQWHGMDLIFQSSFSLDSHQHLILLVTLLFVRPFLLKWFLPLGSKMDGKDPTRGAPCMDETCVLLEKLELHPRPHSDLGLISALVLSGAFMHNLETLVTKGRALRIQPSRTWVSHEWVWFWTLTSQGSTKRGFAPGPATREDQPPPVWSEP